MCKNFAVKTHFAFEVLEKSLTSFHKKFMKSSEGKLLMFVHGQTAGQKSIVKCF